MQRKLSPTSFKFRNTKIHSSSTFLSHSFNPLPKIRSRYDNILNSKPKHIRFSSKIEIHQDSSFKLPDLRLKSDIESRSTNRIKSLSDRSNSDGKISINGSNKNAKKKPHKKTKSIMKKTNYNDISSHFVDNSSNLDIIIDETGCNDENIPINENNDYADDKLVESHLIEQRTEASNELEQANNLMQSEHDFENPIKIHNQEIGENGYDENEAVNKSASHIISSAKIDSKNVRIAELTESNLKKAEVRQKYRKIVAANNTINKLKEDNILVNDYLKTIMLNKANLLKNKKEQQLKSKYHFEVPFTESECDMKLNKDPLKSLNLKFGSSLSEDGNYAMLKCYEDMLCQEIQKLEPKLDSNQISRTKTSIYMQLPRKFNENDQDENKLPKIDQRKLQNALASKQNENNSELLIEIKKHRVRVSKQLEKAMVLSDILKKKRGELVTSDVSTLNGVNNVVNAYQMWTSNWNKIFV